MRPATKTLYVLVGLPFSGKTTIATQLMKDHDALLIERDRFLESLKGDPVTRARVSMRSRSIDHPVSRLGKTQEENAVNDALTLEYVSRVREAISRTDKPVVILDGTHLQPLSRSFVHGLDGWRRIAIAVGTDVGTCVRRFTSANTEGIRSTITPDLIRRMADVYEPPTQAEGFDEIRVLG